MSLSEFEKIIRCHVTLRCNFGCAYCTVPHKDTKELDPEEWISFINSGPYYEARFSGGEPLVYKGMIDILENIDVRSVLYTNLELWKPEYLDVIDREKVRFFISLHPQATFISFLGNVIALRDEGFRIEVHTIEVAELHDKMNELESHGISVNLHADQWKMKYDRGKTKCHLDRSLMGPDGKRYPCVTKVLEGKEDIPLTHYEGLDCDRTNCLPCDVATMIWEANTPQERKSWRLQWGRP